MNKATMIKTAETLWDENDQCFVSRSFLEESPIGVGDTPEEAFKVFLELLDIEYEAYQAGQHGLYNKPGRPSKNKIRLNIELDPIKKRELQTLAKEIGISQGEAVEILLSAYKARQARTAKPKRQKRA